MEIEISQESLNKINRAERVFGIGKEELVDRAILVYLDQMNKYFELKEEFEIWDELSDEALENFERSL